MASQYFVDITPEIAIKFWAKVQKNDPPESGCWIWPDKRSHPRFPLGDAMLPASRVAYALAHNRQMQPRDRLYRRCTTDWCIRPDHFKLLRSRNSKEPEERTKASYTIRPTHSLNTELSVHTQSVVDAMEQVKRNAETVKALSDASQIELLRVDMKILTERLTRSNEQVLRKLAELEVRSMKLAENMTNMGGEMVEAFYAKTAQKLETAMRDAVYEALQQGAMTSPMPATTVSKTNGAAHAPAAANGGSNGGGLDDDGGDNHRTITGFHQALMNLYEREVGIVRDPSKDDYEALNLVFDIAVSECDNDTSRAAKRFAEWLMLMKGYVFNRSSEATPLLFQAVVADGSLFRSATRLSS